MRVASFGLLAWLVTGTAGAVSAGDDVDYAKDVKPILKRHCYACHGALKQEANLRLDTTTAMIQGGDSGAAVKPGEVAGSLLVARLKETDASLRMPAEAEPLKPEEIAVLGAWIEQGAHGVADEQPEPDPRLHWAFQRVERPSLPVAPTNPANGSSTPIDALLAAEHARHGLSPLGAAEKPVLLRRVTLDLTGLPPTREDLHAFMADNSADAYERVVDRLLASPRYGEHWARHWMDVWRYSDWYGRRSVPDVMNSYPQIWRWRDWIVRSLNEDKGYDRMVAEMLAADEVCPDDEDNLPATGFIVRNWFKWNYDQWMKDQTEHTAKAFLGLTMNCALCHDHKYDPISQEEYFRFRAHFEPLELRHDRVAGEPDPGNFKKYVYAQSYGPIGSGRIRIFDEKLDAQTFMYRGGDQRNTFQDKPPVAPGAPSILGVAGYRVEPVNLPPRAYYPGLREFVQQEEAAQRQAAIAEAQTALDAARRDQDQSLSGLQEALAKAEAALAEAVDRAGASPSTISALEGRKSLVLDAVQGRRALAHKAPEFKVVNDQSVVTFLARILTDGHTNFQLAIDINQGSTGGWIGFERGKILSYKPGGFQQIELGQYDVAQDQRDFLVTLELTPSHERMNVTVQVAGTETLLVDRAPATLKGWSGPRNDAQGIFLDARPGTAAMYDDFVFRQADGTVQQRISFEEPAYLDATEVAGTAGWIATAFCSPPATSLVGAPTSTTPEVLARQQDVSIAQQSLHAAELSVTAAERKLVAAQADSAALLARIAADRVRYGIESGDADALALAAADAQRKSGVLVARAELTAAELAVAQAAARPPADAMRAAAVESAQQKRTAATAALAAAEAAAKATDVSYAPLSAVYPSQSTGRRAALAAWMTNRDNPLTARVAVNHIWLRHFGRGIVETPANFGRNGKLPTNQPLIDWLAADLMDGQWTMKRIHRQIITSDAYRRRSQVGAKQHPNMAADAENRYLWRFLPSRMEAETVRDSILFVSCQLESAMGGKEIDIAEGLTSHRRSIYFSHHGEARMEFLELFDAATPSDCYQRTASVRPQQALALSNSELTLVQARRLADVLWTEITTIAADESASRFIVAAFEQILSRPPTKLELEASLRFLAAQGESAPPGNDAAARSRQSFVHALLNHNDFVTVR